MLGKVSRRCVFFPWLGLIIIIMQGIGLGLTIRFAEAGYTVFGLIHKGRTSDEPGSAGEVSGHAKQLESSAHGIIIYSLRTFGSGGKPFWLAFENLNNGCTKHVRSPATSFRCY